ncbi:MAG: 2,5-diamino-6-(ribosylamino)-4(3H)-pyrimidinone 5'-phosphate reductase [Thermoplasmatota archaeon]
MRPFVHVNCAMSVDGKIALANRMQTRISGEADMARVHRLRDGCDAILVGVGTVLTDDPKLTVKKKYVETARQPLRVVLDTRLRTPSDAAVMSDAAPTLIATGGPSFTRGTSEAVACGNGRVALPAVLSLLHERGVERLLVEGGGTVIYAFLKERLVDVMTVYVAPMVIGGAGTPTVADGDGASTPGDVVGLAFADAERLGDGLLLTLHPSVAEDLHEE